MKTISDLIKTDYNMDIFGITDDSRDVRPGYIFVATKGFNVDHFDYIDEAIKAGAVFIVADKKIERNFPHIIVDNIDDYYVDLCIKYYDIKLADLCVGLPKETIKFIQYARDMKFEDKPNYNYLRSLLKKMATKMNMKMDSTKFDWIVKEKNEESNK